MPPGDNREDNRFIIRPHCPLLLGGRDRKLRENVQGDGKLIA